MTKALIRLPRCIFASFLRAEFLGTRILTAVFLSADIILLSADSRRISGSIRRISAD